MLTINSVPRTLGGGNKSYIKGPTEIFLDTVLQKLEAHPADTVKITRLLDNQKSKVIQHTITHNR